MDILYILDIFDIIFIVWRMAVNKKEKTYFTILFLLIFITLITMAIGIGYSYYNGKNNTNNEVDVIVKNISLLMSYDSSNKIYLQELNDGLDYNYNFSITNDSSEYKVNYKLVFDIDSSHQNTEDSNLSYTLTSSLKRQNDDDKRIKIESREIPTEDTILGEGTITPKQVHYYTLNIKYSGENRKDIFIGGISLEKAVE